MNDGPTKFDIVLTIGFATVILASCLVQLYVILNYD